MLVSDRAVQNDQRKYCVHNDKRHMHTLKKSVRNVLFFFFRIIASCSIVMHVIASRVECHIGKYLTRPFVWLYPIRIITNYCFVSLAVRKFNLFGSRSIYVKIIYINAIASRKRMQHSLCNSNK